MHGADLFRSMMAKPGAIVCPGVYDAIGARIVQDVGFKAFYMTGNGAMASLLGKPDLGLATMSEMVMRAHQLASCVEIPLICDADTGYGGPGNISRTVEEFEYAGAAGIHIEDQVLQKRCGALGGLQLVSIDDASRRIETALKARKNGNFMIIARTDAKEVHGLDEALRRAKRFGEIGADAVMVEGLSSLDEIQQVVEGTSAPVLFNIYEKTKDCAYSVKALESIGVKIIVNCLTATLYSAAILKEFYTQFKDCGSTHDYVERMMPMSEYTRILGIDS